MIKKLKIIKIDIFNSFWDDHMNDCPTGILRPQCSESLHLRNSLEPNKEIVPSYVEEHTWAFERAFSVSSDQRHRTTMTRAM
jgi:hypothetical protein